MGFVQLRCLCRQLSELQKPGRRTRSRSTPAFTAAVWTTRATSSERRIGRVRGGPLWTHVSLNVFLASSSVLLFSLSQGRFPEPGERHHGDPGQHGGGDHRGGEDHQTCRWAFQDRTAAFEWVIFNNHAHLRFSALSGWSETGPRGLDRQVQNSCQQPHRQPPHVQHGKPIS